MEESNIKIIYLKNIIDKSLKMICLGIEEIQKIDFFNIENYEIAFLFLSRGFELLLKSMICFKKYKDKNTFPSKKEIKSYGHDLSKMIKMILLYYEEIQIPNNDDKEYMKIIQNDKNIDILIKLLSNFNINGRYFELDLITSDKIFKEIKGKQKMDFSNAPIIKLSNIIYNYLVRNDPELLNRDNLDDLNDPWLKTNKEIIVPSIKMFLRILIRQFEIGILGNQAMDFILKEKYSYFRTEEYKIKGKDIDNLV